MGEIIVTVQTEERLRAINNLSKAISDVAKALASNVTVEIKNNSISCAENGIKIDTAQTVDRTEIKEGLNGK